MGPTEWIVLGVIVFVLFGAKKLPEVAKSFGSSIVEFKKAVNPEAEKDEKKADVAGTEAAQTGGKS